jgi:hypothetical protein
MKTKDIDIEYTVTKVRVRFKTFSQYFLSIYYVGSYPIQKNQILL